MKHIFSILAIAILSNGFVVNSAFATINFKDVCKLQTERENKSLFIKRTVFDVKKSNSISEFNFKMVNTYLLNEKYIESEVTFDVVNAMFSNSDDDLYIDKYISKTTGKVYYEVRSFPGDNPYGNVFDVTGDLIAKIADDDYHIITPISDIYCSDLK